LILHGIELENFKAFNGKHRVDFASPTKRQNIYLIGGLNGSGKTSLVHAIILALLGRSAAGLPGMFLSGRERRRNYEDWLRASFNYQAARDGRDLMAVALTVTDDIGHTHTIRRSWWFDGRRQLEEEGVEVVPQGSRGDMQPLSGEDAERVIAEVVPRHLGELLFFDGEDVRLVAPDGRTIQVETVLDRLLGLEPIKRLVGDLDRLIEARQGEVASEDQLRSLQAMQRHLDALEADLAVKREHLRATEIEATEVQAELVRLEDMTASSLQSDAPLTVAQLRGQLEDLRRRRQEKRQQLGRGLADWLYLLPAWPALEVLLGEIETTVAQRSAVETHKLQSEAVGAFAEGLRDRLAAHGGTPPQVEEIVDVLLREQAEQALGDSFEDVHGNFELDELKLAQASAGRVLSRDLDDPRRLAIDLQELDQSIERLEALRNDFATSSDLERLVGRRYELQEVAGELTAVRSAAASAVEEVAASVHRSQQALRNLSSAFSEDTATREWLLNAASVQAAVRDYVTEARRRALDAVETTLLGALQTLYRKSDYIKSVTIDRVTYEVQARDRNGEHLSMPSAGEQQILALGLAQSLLATSAQTLPLFIDTPLGRLDSQHRHSVVRNYLPNVARQVFVFSTDEEIAGELLDCLKPHTLGQFLIVHDDLAGSSHVAADEYFGPKHE